MTKADLIDAIADKCVGRCAVHCLSCRGAGRRTGFAVLVSGSPLTVILKPVCDSGHELPGRTYNTPVDSVDDRVASLASLPVEDVHPRSVE